MPSSTRPITPEDKQYSCCNAVANRFFALGRVTDFPAGSPESLRMHAVATSSPNCIYSEVLPAPQTTTPSRLSFLVSGKRKVTSNLVCVRPQTSMVALGPRGPVGQNRANADEGHPDLRFNVWQKIGNPPRRVGAPVNQRRSACRDISVKPEGEPSGRNAPGEDCCFAHARILGVRPCSKTPSRIGVPERKKHPSN
jgi:hypothetical protein